MIIRNMYAAREINLDHAPVRQSDQSAIKWEEKLDQAREKLVKPLKAIDLRAKRETPKSDLLLKIEAQVKANVRRAKRKLKSKIINQLKKE